MKMRRLASVTVCLFSLLVVNAQGSTAEIVFFNPEGFVKNVRQVRVRFSEAMTLMGDARDQLQPFAIDCPIKGSGKWEDSTNWVYDFERNLPGGVRVEFRLKPDLKTLSGKPVFGKSVYAFHTGGPSIQKSRPWDGETQIDEEQIFVLQLDCPADETAVRNLTYFNISDVGEKVGVQIIKGHARAAILKTIPYLRETPDSPVLLLQARRRFPNESDIQLVWSRHLRSASGLENEEDQTLSFKVRPAFRAQVNCERVNASAPCIPIRPIVLNFSSPVAWPQIRQTVLEEPDGKKHFPVRPRDSEEQEQFVQAALFEGPFPEQSLLKVTLPANLRDDAGRSLINQSHFPLEIRTDDSPPLVKFAADFGILELNADPILPLTVRNVEPTIAGALVEVKEGNKTISPVEVMDAQQSRTVLNLEQTGEVDSMQGRIFRLTPDRANQLRLWLKKLSDQVSDRNKREQSIFSGDAAGFLQTVSVPKLKGGKSFEVVGIPLKKPGFYVVEIKSEILGSALLGSNRPMYVSTAALVTNLSVHFKWGAQSSLVWVTTLDNARLVSGAHVEVRDCEGNVLWKGETDKDGIARPVGLPQKDELRDCMYCNLGTGLLVSAQVGDDYSFVFSSWDNGIEPWRFNLPTEYSDTGQIVVRTVFDRPLFRAGETVYMKHFLRRQTLEGFGLAPSSDRAANLQIMHAGSDKKYEIPLKWFPDGTAESRWQIPQEAHLGYYQIFMQLPKEDARRLYAGSFRVEEFRLPIMRASISPPAQNLVAPARITCGLQASYLSGGGASNLSVRFRHQVIDTHVMPPDNFEDYVFSNGRVKEGIRRFSGEEPDERIEAGGAIKSQAILLDKTGHAQVEISQLPEIDRPKAVQAELEYPDPNGEIQTVSRRIPIYPSEYIVGIKPDSWVGSREKLKFRVVVADLLGNPVAGAAIQSELFTQRYYSHRRRLVGGFYEYDSVSEIKKAGAFCNGVTDEHGLLICEGAAPVEGSVILQVSTKDPSGRPSTVYQNVWVSGKESWWFDVSKDDRIDVLPEKKRYEPGDTARFQVRMPFREATALVSVEREGVSDVFIQKLTSQEPLVEVPVKPNYAPNIFISILVIRGRIGDTQPTAMVDLGRPAYKLGITEIKVGWKGHELKVHVSTPKDVYQVREKVPVEIRVQQADTLQPAAGGEVAVAAVDEALLELLPNDSWNLLSAMMGQRPLSVWSSTSQMHVIGKRHFGLKSLPIGGGGGQELSRELFDTLLLWRGRLALDDQGMAKIEVPLNDSLSSFRIVAVAHAGTGRFGTGSRTIRSTQDLMVISGIPPVVRETDHFAADFTVRNNTANAMSLVAQLEVDGLNKNFLTQTFILGANEAKAIQWEITVPLDCDLLSYKVSVQSDSGQRDQIQIKQKVNPFVSVKPWQSTIFQLDRKQATEVLQPRDNLAGRGGVQVLLRPKIADGLPGVIDYMKKYPYSCLEQEASRAVALRDEKRWNFIMDRLPAYLDTHGLAKYFPTAVRGSVELTAYILSIGHEAGWPIPDSSRERLMSGLSRFLDGKIGLSSIYGARDLDAYKLLAMEALTRYRVPVGDWLQTMAINPNLWPTSALVDWREILKRQPNLPDHNRRAAEVDKILGARLDFRGTAMGFTTEQDDFRWWLMACGDANVNRMILSVLDSPAWNADMPRLIRGSLHRQKAGRWTTTFASAWGVLALEKFSRFFESQRVQGISRVQLNRQKQQWDWAKEPEGKSLSFKWPEGAASLDLEHQGDGKPWAVITSLAAIPLKAPFSNGYRVQKTMTPVMQKTRGVWSRGDIVRIRLECEAQTDMGWVVVNDPIPGGAAILGTGLGRDSQLSAHSEKREGWIWPVFEERTQDAFRAYYEYIPKGKWVVEYAMRLNNTGRFQMPSTRIEAIYAPEMLGELPNETFTVAP